MLERQTKEKALRLANKRPKTDLFDEMLFTKENINKLAECIKPSLELGAQISKHPDIVKLLEFLDDCQN